LSLKFLAALAFGFPAALIRSKPVGWNGRVPKAFAVPAGVTLKLVELVFQWIPSIESSMEKVNGVVPLPVKLNETVIQAIRTRPVGIVVFAD
jgi:hypothetical protein